MKTKRWVRSAPYIIAIALFLGILAARAALDNQLAPGEDPYLQARIARTFHTKGIIARDHLLVGGTPIAFTPYKATVALISYVTGDMTAAMITPIIFAILLLHSLNRLLEQIGRPAMERAITLSILAASPTFLHDGLVSGPNMAIIALTAMSATLLLDKKSSRMAGGLAAAAMASSFSPIASLSVIVLDTILMVNRRISWKWISAMVIMCVIGASVIPAEVTAASASTGTMLSDLGALDGLPIFMIMMAMIGVWLLWPQKLACASIIALFIAAAFNHGLITEANTVAACLAGAAAAFLANRRWNVSILKPLSLTVISCGIIFSTISTSTQMSTMGPSENIAKSLEWLKSHSRSGEVVLSAPSNGHWIQYFSVRPTTTDPRTGPTDNRTIEAAEALKTYNMNVATDYLRLTNATYIYISPDMTNGSVWSAPGIGLHYLLSDRETFKRSYQSGGIEIYEYMRIAENRRP